MAPFDTVVLNREVGTGKIAPAAEEPTLYPEGVPRPKLTVECGQWQ